MINANFVFEIQKIWFKLFATIACEIKFDALIKAMEFGRSILGGQMMKFSKMKREPLKFGRAQKNLRLSSALIMPVILWTILAKTAYSNVLKSKVLTQNRKLQNFCIKSLSAALVQNEQR